MWNIEKDPILRSTIVAVALLDSVPDWERLRRRIDITTCFIPRLRQRVVSPPFRIAPPRWMAEPSFDLDFHLRRVRLAGPRNVAGVVRRAAADRDDELRPGPTAVGVHALRGARRSRRRTRGDRDEGASFGHRRRRRHAAARPLRRPHPRRARRRRPRRSPPRSRPRTRGCSKCCGSRSRTRAAARSGSRPRIPAERRPHRGAYAFATRSGRVPTSCARPGRSRARSRPATSPMSTLMLRRGLGRRLEAFDVSLDEMRRVAKECDGSLNDVFVASVIGGVRRYHERHGAAPIELRMTLPINLRQGDDDAGGNRFAPGPVPRPDRHRRSAGPHRRARRPDPRMAGRARAPDDEHARRNPQPAPDRDDDRVVRRDAQVLRLRDLERSGRARRGVPRGRGRRAHVRVRPARRRRVQRHPDLALRHLLYRRRRRHDRGARPRRPARLPAPGFEEVLALA